MTVGQAFPRTVVGDVDHGRIGLARDREGPAPMPAPSLLARSGGRAASYMTLGAAVGGLSVAAYMPASTRREGRQTNDDFRATGFGFVPSAFQ